MSDQGTRTGNIGRTTIYVCPFCGVQHLDRYETRSPRCPHRGDHFEAVEMIPSAGVLPAEEAERLRTDVEGLAESAVSLSRRLDEQIRLYEAAMNWFPEDEWERFEESDEFRVAESRELGT